MLILHAKRTKNRLFGSCFPSTMGWKQSVLLTNTNWDCVTISEDILGNGFMLRFAHLSDIIFWRPLPSHCNSEYMVTLPPPWATISSYEESQLVSRRPLRFQNCSVGTQARSELSRFRFHLTLHTTPADKSYDYLEINYFYSQSVPQIMRFYVPAPIQPQWKKQLVLRMQLPHAPASWAPCSRDVNRGNCTKPGSVGYTLISNVTLNH